MIGLAIRQAWAWIAGTALLAAGGAGAAGAEAVPAATAVDLRGIETRSAALMLSAQEAGDLEVSVAALPLPEDPASGTGRARVILVVDVAGGPLVAGLPPETSAAGDGSLVTEIYAYALDAAGGLAGTLTRAFRLDGAARPALAAGGVKFFGHLDLAAGDYSLRVLTLQRSSGRMGLEVLPLAVPSWSGAGPAWLPPVACEDAGGWLLVFEEGEPPPPFPLTIDGRPSLPATRWRVDADGGGRYLLLGRALDAGLRAHLLGADGEELLEVGMGDLRPVAGGLGGLDAVVASFDAAGLEGGDYRLRISAAAGPAASSPLSIRAAEDPGLWAGGETPPAAGSGGRDRGARAQAERVTRARDAYLKSLRALGGQDPGAMVRPLVELERREIGGGERGEQKRLGEAELQAAWEIAGRDADGLLPMIWIHGELYRQYHSRKLYLLATHSRRVLSSLAEIYLERGSSPRARHFVASALVGVAGYLQASGALPAAEDAYRAALEHQEDHPAARIGLATLAESYGDYAAAARLLEGLHREPGADPQVALRLGVNLRRLGKDRRAAELLREALAAAEPAWVSAVAAQELATLLAEEERLEEATAVLEAALERHPDLQRLRIQLAALLDRAGEGAAARAVLDGLDPTAGRQASSPRLRYSRMPTRALAEARRTLAEEARRRLPEAIDEPVRAAGPNVPAGGPRDGAR